MKRIGFVAIVLLLSFGPLLTSCKKKEEASTPAPTAPAAPMTTTAPAPAAAPAAH